MEKRIPDNVIEKVRKSNDIVDVIGEVVHLKRQGRDFVGLCPFHDEKTPSFSVSQEKQLFHCFGCKKGGTVFKFIMELEGYSFQDALKALGNRSGVDLPDLGNNYESSLSSESQSLLLAHEWLTKLYHHLLRYTEDGKSGYDYFKKRGITKESIDLFQLGFAPNVEEFTAEFLEKKGLHQQLLIKAGLLNLRDDNSVTDRFRGRVVFPIRNHLGKTVAFGGRAISGQTPKYLNSSESDLFQKSRILYNFDLAKRYIRQENEVVLLEGYMDVISAHQAGVKNVTATLGTSLSESQAKLLNRYVDTVILCYDSDHAGVEATYKAALLLRKVGCHVKIANLKTNTDPDSYINEYGAEAFKNEVIKASHTFMNFYMEYIKKDYNLNVENDRIQYIEVILKQLSTIDSAVEREIYLAELSREFNLSIDTLSNEIQVMRQKMGNQKDKREQNRYTSTTAGLYQNKKLLPAYHNAERQLIAYMLQDGSITDRVQKEIGLGFNIESHKVIVTHLYAFYEEYDNPDVNLFVEKITDEKIAQQVIELAMIPLVDNITDDEINDYIKAIRIQTNDIPTINTIRQEQKLAERQNNPLKAAKIAMQIIEIKKQM